MRKSLPDLFWRPFWMLAAWCAVVAGAVAGLQWMGGQLACLIYNLC